MDGRGARLIGLPRADVFMRSEVLAMGGDDRTIRRALRSGEWVRVRPGAYAGSEHWTGLDARGRHRVLTAAVMRSLAPRVAASHVSAALEHNLDTWDIDLTRTHVTRLDGGAGRTERDLVHHEGLALDNDLVQVGDLSCVTAVRAALETAILGGVERGLVTVDSGLRNNAFTKEDLFEQHDIMASWPGAQHLHLVTRLADGRSGSAGETRTRFLCWSEQLPMPELQYPVYDGGVLIGICDFAWPELGVFGEFDGKLKYVLHLRDGEEPADAVFREKRREDEIRRVTGWRCIRIVWSDLSYPARTAARIRAVMAQAA